MAYIPKAVRALALIKRLTAVGLYHLNSGKVGEMFYISDRHLLMVRTDRISIFDFVLNGLVRRKGCILTAMTVKWLTNILASVIDKFGAHHLVAWGRDIDRFLPVELRNDPDLQSRALVVMNLPGTDYEAIVRGYLSGSSVAPYLETGMISGHRLPPGLHDGSQLPTPMFTPSNKAKEGHDIPIDWRWVREKYGPQPQAFVLALYSKAADYAEDKGIILADTKFELTFLNRVLCLFDEVLTPDSSRFWERVAWELAQQKDPPCSPPGYDKQYVREKGKKISTPFFTKDGNPIVGINKLDPRNDEHVAFVSGFPIAQSVLEATTDLYEQCFERLFGQPVSDFWQDAGVKLAA